MQDTDLSSVCEIGFGVPQRYVRYLLQGKQTKRIVLADFEVSSIKFAQAVLSFWEELWKEKVSFLQFDMNNDDFPHEHETYILQDSIEHAFDPTSTLRRFVSSINTSSNILFSLPIEIENPIPEHHIYWKDESQVIAWLESCGLMVSRYEVIAMDRKVDIFARSLHRDFREIVVQTKKGI
ncbi:MAG: hypothetical protein IPK84_05025 [Candidatus Moraniibacteriota bacterium]|nr:MAG: hypothetical protein IPK84_05025 [Candidatus Moranbacteria bacterium]